MGESSVHRTLRALWYCRVDIAGVPENSFSVLVRVINSAMATLNECFVSMTALT